MYPREASTFRPTFHLGGVYLEVDAPRGFLIVLRRLEYLVALAREKQFGHAAKARQAIPLIATALDVSKTETWMT